MPSITTFFESFLEEHPEAKEGLRELIIPGVTKRLGEIEELIENLSNSRIMIATSLSIFLVVDESASKFSLKLIDIGRCTAIKVEDSELLWKDNLMAEGVEKVIKEVKAIHNQLQ
jgi:hypothetical protein